MQIFVHTPLMLSNIDTPSSFIVEHETDSEMSFFLNVIVLSLNLVFA